MKQGTILVIDDDREMRVSLSHLLEKGGFEVVTARDGEEGLKLLGGVDAALSDVRMPRMDGLTFQRQAADISRVPVVLFSAHGDIPLAVEAIQNGAYNFIEKPFDPRRLLTLLGNAVRLKRLTESAARLERRLAALTDLEQILIGDALSAVRRDIHDYAGSPANVLITGETGTGKELVARALHDLGRGPSAPFVAVNCAIIPPESFEEKVFARDGLLHRADGGTLFLDELTSMPAESQSKILRVIETRTVGEMPVDVRLISASSQPGEAAVAEGLLRQDLYFRLNTLVIDLPPLAARGDDVILIFRHYLQRLSALYECRVPELAPSDVSALLTHGWPGNVRELQSVAERFVLASRRGSASIASSISSVSDGGDMPTTLREAVAAFERQLIAQAISDEAGRMDDVAHRLGIGRRTLNEKIVKLGIDKGEVLAPGG
ncbi:MAG: sigma-54 dependent transcriptional regulator [Rhodobacteraceae bacterium]|nr:sigma-54 dependent transcriptional regulator [Paracoccaceae bacterium]